MLLILSKRVYLDILDLMFMLKALFNKISYSLMILITLQIWRESNMNEDEVVHK